MHRDDTVGAQLRDCRFVGNQGSMVMRGTTVNPSSYSTAGPVTYTANDLLSGIIVRNCGGAARSDVLPTAALLVAAIPRVQVGDILRCMIINGSATAAEVITLGAGAGGSFDTNQLAASRVIGGAVGAETEIAIRFTNVTVGSEAYTVYM